MASDDEDSVCGTQYTFDWVVTKLCESCNVPKGKLKSKSAERIGIGQGFLSVIARVNLEWESNAHGKLPTVVVLKVPTMATLGAIMEEREEFKEMAEFMSEDEMDKWLPLAHNNECYMYELMRSVETVPLKMPIIYGWQRMSTVKKPGALLMEDFSTRQGGIINKADGCSVNQVKEVVKSIAALYAWALKRPDESWIDKIEVMEKALDNWKEMSKVGHKPLMSVSPERFTEESVTKVSFCFEHKYIKEMFMPQNTMATLGLPKALVQGDMWTNNLLFRKNDDGTISDELLALIDWQTLHAGNPMEDLCRLLVSSCPSSMRHAIKDDMIELYYQHCEKCFGGKLPFGVEQLRTAYDFVYPFGMSFYATSVPMIMQSPAVIGEEGDPKRESRQNELLDRAKDAMNDCNEHMKQLNATILAKVKE